MDDAVIRRVGFIGLGNMGLPIATRIAEAGFDLWAHDARPQLQDELPQGVHWVPEAGELAAGVDALLLCLPDGAAVTDLMLGGGALAKRMRRGTVLVDLSSSSPDGTVTLGSALHERGVAMIDAPVSGGVERAWKGELTMMAGGEPDAIEHCRGVFDAVASQVFVTGQLGSGHASKALNNYVSAAGLLASLEALAAAERFGVDPEVVLQVINASSGRNNSTETKISQFVFSETFASGFALALMAKDVRTAQRLARDLGVSARLLDVCAELWDEGAARAPVAADHTEVGRVLGLGAASRSDRRDG